MKTPSQPSPTNLSDELKTILDNFARWTIQNVEHGIYIPLPSPETEAAITAVYAEAIRSTVPEKKDPQARHLFETDNGTMVDTVLPPYINGFNAAIDTFTASLQEAGLLPTNGSDGGSADT